MPKFTDADIDSLVWIAKAAKQFVVEGSILADDHRLDTKTQALWSHLDRALAAATITVFDLWNEE